MDHTVAFRYVSAVCLILAAPIALVQAQSPAPEKSPGELFRTIASLDSALFDSYNRCDLAKFAGFFIDDVEFYHDKGGVTLGKRDLTESVKKDICGKVRRELVPGTLEVYPIHDYGAVELGTHRFHHPNAEATEPVGEAKFMMLWEYKNGAWKITRVISYGHIALPK
jgi:hypothetical protein